MELLAAIDLLEGGAVRLVKGEFDRATRFGDAPAVASRFLEAGAPWLHVVDLDAARSGAPVNRAVVLALGELAHRHGARIEVGGGIRTAADVDELLGGGDGGAGAGGSAAVDRVVLGTAAIETPDYAARCARRYPGRVAVGIDYRRAVDGTLVPAVRGWTDSAAQDVPSLVAAFEDAGVAALVVTAIDRDGTASGPDLEGVASVLDMTVVPVLASGGVGSAGDLRALAGLRSPAAGRSVSGAVVGRALVDGSIDVGEAVAACAAS
ncbi:MAG: HisA/HisF-related TIM barrel protein, partial [Acidimicrobiales bacterium]